MAPDNLNLRDGIDHFRYGTTSLRKKSYNVTEEIKHLAFKGIEKKEQIVLKSFLNLAKNELKYKISVLKDNDKSGQGPEILIVADGYDFSDGEETLESLPCIVLGDDLGEEWAGYITNPIQWSDFRLALTQFSEPTPRGSAQKESEAELVVEAEDVAEDNVVDQDVADMSENLVDEELLTTDELYVDDELEEALPEEAKFAIEETDQEQTKSESLDDFAPIDHEFELDNMSVDYDSHTNSDYLKVVDDVQQFQDGEADQPSAMLLVTDDESSSTNSVLVIETNSLDAWDFSEAESAADMDSSEIAKQAVAEMDVDDVEAEVVVPDIKSKSGFDIASGEKYWEEDNEIIADNISVLCIKHQRKMVYSTKEPGKWLGELQGKKLSKLPLNNDWRPKKGLTAYPISQLIWVDTLMTESDALSGDLKEDVEYILEKWPHFDLLQLDNVLLKLCSLLFVQPESLNSLIEKSGYSRSTVRGLMNACYKEGLLKNTDDVQVDNLIAAGDDGVLGKIKGVFR